MLCQKVRALFDRSAILSHVHSPYMVFRIRAHRTQNECIFNVSGACVQMTVLGLHCRQIATQQHHMCLTVPTGRSTTRKVDEH